MRHIVIIYKKDLKVENLARQIADRLNQDSSRYVIAESAGPAITSPIRHVPYPPDLIISLGGDGTLLHAVRLWGWDGTPVLGINAGRLGFMAAVELEELWPTLTATLEKRFTLDPRLALTASLIRQGNIITRISALNDIVINKGALGRVMDFKAWVNNSASWSYRADGLIVATPTGSTAYNLSAGGPVVHPSIASIIMTPICPVTLSIRPFLLPEDSEIDITISANDAEAHLTADGQVTMPLKPGDIISIKKAHKKVNLIANLKRNYLELLRAKLGWS